MLSNSYLNRNKFSLCPPDSGHLYYEKRHRLVYPKRMSEILNSKESYKLYGNKSFMMKPNTTPGEQYAQESRDEKTC